MNGRGWPGREVEGATKGRPEGAAARRLLTAQRLWHIDEMPLTAGTHLGPYEIVATLGAGGMGEVYRARDTRLGRDLAIKILPARVASTPGFRERFAREARAISARLGPYEIIAPLGEGRMRGTSDRESRGVDARSGPGISGVEAPSKK